MVMMCGMQDILGFLFFTAFGLWWLLIPNSVIRFYNWFHGGKIRMPGPIGVRVVGALWVALVVVVFAVSRQR